LNKIDNESRAIIGLGLVLITMISIGHIQKYSQDLDFIGNIIKRFDHWLKAGDAFQVYVCLFICWALIMLVIASIG